MSTKVLFILLMMMIGWFLGLLCFLAVIGIMLFPILAIVYGVMESKQPVVEGKSRYKKTILFIVLTVASFFALVLGLVAWSVTSYAFSIAPYYM